MLDPSEVHQERFHCTAHYTILQSGRGYRNVFRSISHNWMSHRHSPRIIPSSPPSSLYCVCVYTQYTGSSQVLGVYVSLVMFCQVVAPHEAFLTLAALEALVSCEGNTKCWDPGFKAEHYPTDMTAAGRCIKSIIIRFAENLLSFTIFWASLNVLADLFSDSFCSNN